MEVDNDESLTHLHRVGRDRVGGLPSDGPLQSCLIAGEPCVPRLLKTTLHGATITEETDVSN